MSSHVLLSSAINYRVQASPLASQQAVETLAGGVGLGAPRHRQRQFSQKANKVKRKKSRFLFCQCGTNPGLYDDGLNTSFVASSNPSEKVIGRIRAGSLSVAAPTMPFIEYVPGRPQNHRRVHSKTDGGEGGERRASSIAPPPLPKYDQKEQLERGARPMSPCDTVSGSCDETLSATSFSPEAQVLTAVRANLSETVFAEDQTFETTPAHQVALLALTRSVHDGYSHPSDVLDLPLSLPPACEPQERKEHPQAGERIHSSHKRRGGFLGPSSDSPAYDIEEQATVNTLACSALSPYRNGQAVATSSYSSLASTLSKYSTTSPALELASTPSRATMGGARKELQEYRYTTNTLTSLASRSSTTSSRAALSEQSPAICDVLSHFPSLSGKNWRELATQSHTDMMTDGAWSTRVNTFGPPRLSGDVHASPGRVGSVYYDNEPPFQLKRTMASSSYSPSSTPSSADSHSTLSTTLSQRSHKRTAVLCGFPSHGSLAMLSRRSETEGDLTWEEKLLALSDGEQEQERDEDETVDTTHLRSSAGNLMLRSPTASCGRARDSSTSQAPFSPPPNLPLPPVPSPSLPRQRCHHMRSSNSLVGSYSTRVHGQASPRPMPTHLPRSSTCPDVANSGLAF